jgi:hypothetical protein
MTHPKKHVVKHSTFPGKQFMYYCPECSLILRGYDNKNYVKAADGWTWELVRNDEEIDSAGNQFVRHYGGTEREALEEGLERFEQISCLKPN